MPPRSSARLRESAATGREVFVADRAPRRRFDVVRPSRAERSPLADASIDPVRRGANGPRGAEADRFSGASSASWRPVAAGGRHAAVEQYRRLAGSLLQAQVAHDVRVVMMASAMPGEGKSLTTANLALTLSKSYGRNTLLVDADTRRPSQHEIFHVGNHRGLNEYLDPRHEEALATVQLYPALALVTAGRPTSEPLAGLTSPRMQALIAEAASTFDFVLIDTPPVTLMSDAHVLSQMADGVVLVVAAGDTQFDAITRAVETIGRDRILGVVLNRAVDDIARHERYATYY